MKHKTFLMNHFKVFIYGKTQKLWHLFVRAVKEKITYKLAEKS